VWGAAAQARPGPHGRCGLLEKLRTARAKWRTGQARRARPDPLSRGGSRLAAGEQVSAGMLRSQDRMIRGARATNRCAPAARRAAPACMALGSRPLVRLPAGEHTPPPVPPSCRFKKLRPAAAPPTPPGRISPAGRAAPCLHTVTAEKSALTLRKNPRGPRTSRDGRMRRPVTNIRHLDQRRQMPNRDQVLQMRHLTARNRTPDQVTKSRTDRALRMCHN